MNSTDKKYPSKMLSITFAIRGTKGGKPHLCFSKAYPKVFKEKYSVASGARSASLVAGSTVRLCTFRSSTSLWPYLKADLAADFAATGCLPSVT